MGRRALEFAKDLSGYSSVDNYVNRSEGIINPELAGAALAIGSYGMGRLMAPSTSAIGKAANEVGGFTGNTIFNKTAIPIQRMGRGGRMYDANTPFGPIPASTRIMSPEMYKSAQRGLLTVVGNTADFAASAAKKFSADAINRLAREMTMKENLAGSVTRTVLGMND